MTDIFAVSLIEESAFEACKPTLLGLIPESGREKISSYARINDAQRSLLGEVLVRYLISEIKGVKLPEQPFTTGEKGKPAPDGFDGIHFNISHSGRWVVVALSSDRVGVDVERIRKVPDGVAHRFFSEAENAMLQNAASETQKADIFFTLWTLKESFLKAIGKGLTKSLSSFTVAETGNQAYCLTNDPEAAGFYLKVYELSEGYKLAACSAVNQFSEKVKIVGINELTGY